MSVYPDNTLQMTVTGSSTEAMPVGIVEITEADLDFVSGGKKTVSGDKVIVKSNGDIECTGNCTVTVN